MQHYKLNQQPTTTKWQGKRQQKIEICRADLISLFFVIVVGSSMVPPKMWIIFLSVAVARSRVGVPVFDTLGKTIFLKTTKLWTLNQSFQSMFNRLNMHVRNFFFEMKTGITSFRSLIDFLIKL